MFEKDVETKYCKGCKLRMEQCLWAWRNTNGLNEPNEKNCSCKEVPAFITGAEFGYNKAMEWHYVKDEGTPKVEGHYLVCLRNKDKDIFDCWIYYDKDVGWYSMKVRMEDIYAWKEIVPPKESK